MKIDELIGQIAGDPECKLFPPSGIPRVQSDILAVPSDVATFYQRCGGAELFSNQDFGFRIATPQEFVPVNPVVLGGFYLEHKAQIDANESSGWYLIAREFKTKEAISIDLNLAKNGYCYDSFWEVHASENSKVVAQSFTELIERLYAARGAGLYWEMADFNLGHAFD